MTSTKKVLGQIVPASANTNIDLYTVPASTQTTVSTITACNQAGASATFQIRIRVGGAATSAEQVLYYNLDLPANDTFAATFGITLGAGDVITVQASATTVSFTAFGVEEA